MRALSLLLLLLFQAGPARPQPIGVITGIIRLADGTPAKKVRVFARPTGSVTDETVLEAQAETDGAGRYRLEVSPGQYYIAAGFIASPTWHPGTNDVARARPIVVSSNANIPLDITALATSVLAASVQIQVVSAASGAPLRDVTLEFWGMLAPATSIGTSRSVQRRFPAVTVPTDASGNAAFRNLAPGRYVVSARLSGYLIPAPSEIPINPTDTSRQIQIRLVPSASIAGRVNGGDGKPLASVPVWAGALEYVDGRRKLVARAMTQTDAQGGYRLSPLEPGAYYVVAERAKTDLLGLASTYYPGTMAFDEATPVAVRHAQDLSGIEFTVAAPRTFSVSGRVQNAPGRIATFHLVRHDPGSADGPYPVELANTSPTSAGDFLLRGITPGSWDVYPVIPRTRPAPGQPGYIVGAGKVDVLDRDVSGVTIALNPTTEVRGRVVMPNGGAMPTEISVALVPRDSKPHTLVSHLTNIQHVTATNGAFAFPGVPPGQYSIRLSYVPAGYHVEGLRAGNKDVFETSLIEVGGTPIEPLELILGNGGSSFRGFFNITLAYMTADQLRDVRVTLVPSGTRRSNLALYQTLTIPRAGEPFVFSGVVPGDYKVFAWSSLPPDAEKSPEFIGRYEGLGAEIRVGSAQVPDVQVSVIAMP